MPEPVRSPILPMHYYRVIKVTCCMCGRTGGRLQRGADQQFRHTDCNLPSSSPKLEHECVVYRGKQAQKIIVELEQLKAQKEAIYGARTIPQVESGLGHYPKRRRNR